MRVPFLSSHSGVRTGPRERRGPVAWKRSGVRPCRVYEPGTQNRKPPPNSLEEERLPGQGCSPVAPSLDKMTDLRAIGQPEAAIRARHDLMRQTQRQRA